MRKAWIRVATQLATLALLLTSGSAFAWPCDFLTGGGFIIHNGFKANFGVGMNAGRLSAWIGSAFRAE